MGTDKFQKDCGNQAMQFAGLSNTLSLLAAFSFLLVHKMVYILQGVS